MAGALTQSIYFKARLVKDGPFVGVRVFFGGPLVGGEIMDRSPRWQAVVGNEVDGRMILAGDDVPIEVDGVTLRNLERVPEADHRYLLAHQDWAQGTTHPRATPRDAVDFNAMPIPRL